MRKAEKQLRDIGFKIWFISIDKPELLLESLDEPDIGDALPFRREVAQLSQG